jgi:hypothetical protein
MSKVQMMPEERFWSLISKSRALVDRSQAAHGDAFQELQIEHLSDLLSALAPEEIVGFDIRATYLAVKAYRWELWDAVYWAHGGCGDDGFTDFRDNLVSLGRDTYRRVLIAPDDLADLLNQPDVPYMLSEGFGYTAGKVYQQRTGRDIQEYFGLYPTAPEEPLGERGDPDDEEEIRRRFPKLYAKFPDMGD